MLSKLKNMLGISKPRPRPTRHSDSSAAPGSRDGASSFDVTFSEKSLGLSLASGLEDSQAVVAAVVEGSPAWTAGVTAGCLLTHFDGNEIVSFEAFNAVCGAMGRPVVLRFS